MANRGSNDYDDSSNCWILWFNELASHNCAKQLNLNVSNSSLWMISTIIGMSIGMMTFGSIFDYFGPRRAFAIFLIGSALMVYTLSLAQNMTMLLIIGAVVGFFLKWDVWWLWRCNQ